MPGGIFKPEGILEQLTVASHASKHSIKRKRPEHSEVGPPWQHKDVDSEDRL